MSRQRRNYGETLHVIVRGIGKQILFEENLDFDYYLFLLRKHRNETGIVLLAYCLMDNHVHLLIRDPEQNISIFMKKMGVSYAGYFNQKYERVGHLFQDRYKSEKVDTTAYLLTVFRYILRNPEKAGISKAEKYPWSSFREYGKTGCLTDTSSLLEIIGSKDSFLSFMGAEDDTEVMESEPFIHDDEWALNIIQKVCKVQSGTMLQQMQKQERDEALVLLKSKGLTIRQLERLTGINRGVIQRAKLQ